MSALSDLVDFLFVLFLHIFFSQTNNKVMRRLAMASVVRICYSGYFH